MELKDVVLEPGFEGMLDDLDFLRTENDGESRSPEVRFLFRGKLA